MKAEQTRSSQTIWTASRCNRTVRHLNSFLSKLQKWHKEHTSQLSEAAHDNSLLEECTPGQDQAGSHNIARSDLWLNPDYQARRQRNKRPNILPSVLANLESDTLRRRPRRSGPDVSSPIDEIPISSIATDEFRDSGMASPAEAGTWQRAGPKPLSGQYSRCKHVVNCSDFSFNLAKRSSFVPGTYESVVIDAETIIVAFLKATTVEKDSQVVEQEQRPVKRGTLSLTDICLNRLGRQIVEDQREIDSVADGFDGQVDALGTMCQELEEHFAVAHGGWASLREVVRSFGISAVCSSIASGALHLHVAKELVKTTAAYPEYDDFTTAVIETMLREQKVIPHAGSTETLQGCRALPAFEALFQFTNLSPNLSTFATRYRLLRQSLAQESSHVLHIWFIRTSTIFSNLLYHFGYGMESQPAMFAEHLLSSYFGLEDSRWSEICHQVQTNRKTTRSDSDERPQFHSFDGGNSSDVNFPKLVQGGLLSLLSSMVVQRPYQALPILEKLSMKLAGIIEMHGLETFDSNQQKIIARIFFYTFMCLTEAFGLWKDYFLVAFDEIIRAMIKKPHSYQWYASQLSHFCTKVVAGRWRPTTKDSLKMFTDLDFQHYPHLHAFTTRVTTDAVLDFARLDPTTENLQWAEMVQQKAAKQISSLDPKLQTPGLKKCQIGYRWDTNLEEWIANTPTSMAPRPIKRPFVLEDEKPRWQFLELQAENGATSNIPFAPVTILRPNEQYFDGDFPYKKPKRKSTPLTEPSPSLQNIQHEAKRRRTFDGKTISELMSEVQESNSERHQWSERLAYRKLECGGGSLKAAYR